MPERRAADIVEQVIPLIVAVPAFVAGTYLRAFAGGFEADPSDTRRESRRAFRALRRAPIPAWPPTAELVTAALCALVAWRFAPAHLPGLLYLTLAGVALAMVDWRTSRLPDVITIPSYPILAALTIPTGELPRALLGGLSLAALYGLLWFARPTAMGLGDVKLAGLIGMASCALGWNAWILAAILGQVFGALYAAALLLRGKAERGTEFPLGPFMLAGALTGICLA